MVKKLILTTFTSLHLGKKCKHNLRSTSVRVLDTTGFVVLYFVAVFAAEEVGQAYADAMAPLQSTLWLVVALVAIVAAAECGLWIAKKLIK